MWVDNEEKRQTIMRVKLLLALSLFCPATILGQKFTNYFNGEPDCYDSFMSGIFRFAISDTLNMEVCLITSQNVDGEIIISENVISPDNKKYTVTSIASQAFMSAKRLKSIVVPNSVKAIGTLAFAFCDSLESVVLSNKIEQIPDACFKQCKSLDNIIPGSVVSIGELAFEGCAFKSVILTDNLVSISEQAFCYCDSLRNIFNYSISPQLISNDTFIGCHNVVLHVKQGYHEPYRSSLWSRFIIKDDI